MGVEEGRKWRKGGREAEGRREQRPATAGDMVIGQVRPPKDNELSGSPCPAGVGEQDSGLIEHGRETDDIRPMEISVGQRTAIHVDQSKVECRWGQGRNREESQGRHDRLLGNGLQAVPHAPVRLGKFRAHQQDVLMLGRHKANPEYGKETICKG